MSRSAIQKRDDMAKVLKLMRQKKTISELRSEFGKSNWERVRNRI
jgi:hypothetical protein